MKKQVGRYCSAIIRFAMTVMCLCILFDPLAPSRVLAAETTTVPRPLVAIHVSELTAALESAPALSPTPTGADNTGYQWWYKAWKYPVAYESLKEALRSDGTLFVEISDSDIAAGNLCYQDGTPRYPVLISLASEAVADNEVSLIREYVNAGGFLFVGSSAFTRRPDGTTRGDFALADVMGLHMVNPNLLNRYENGHFTKVNNDNWFVSHFPSGELEWYAPLTAEEIPLGVSPIHVRNTKHYAWQVVAGSATVLALGDAGPLVTINSYGKGNVFYHGAFQPLIGHGGFDATMYPYLVFRKVIGSAFDAFGLPEVKLSPWRYPYDAALLVRHDFENRIDLIKAIEASAQFEKSVGVKGDYYFCTGALRTYDGTDKAAIISGLQKSVADYGATIGSHNGGLPNPVNLSLLPSEYDYWHWGPDEALDQSPIGYSDGKAYAAASINASFLDIEGWLNGLDNGRSGCAASGNCPRSWVSPAFNSTRGGSSEILEQSGVLTAGEQKVGPFPHWTLSYDTPTQRYTYLSLPVSDWYNYDGTVMQSLDMHTSATMKQAVNLYYDLGALINLYDHAPSNNGSVQQEYVTYSMSKPRVWSTNSIGIYDWWLLRSKVQITPTVEATDTTYVAVASVSGVSDAETAIEVTVPKKYSGNISVFINGTLVSPTEYRATTSGVKIKVGPSVSEVKVRVQNIENAAPVAVNDSYSVYANLSLVKGAPGVLVNDTDTEGAILKAQLVNGPSHGSLVFNIDGSFTYTPSRTYVGNDSFTYIASDGTVASNVATVNITVLPALVMSSLSLEPSTIFGGTNTQLTATLSGPAPDGGVVAILSDGSSNSSLPIPVGSSTVSISINTNPVAVSKSFTIYAAYGGVTKTAVLTIKSPQLATFTMTPAIVNGGEVSQCEATLNVPAPVGGAVIKLVSGSATGSVTVPVGSTSIIFPIIFDAVATTATYTISATYGDVTKSASVTVKAQELSSLTVSPDNVIGGAVSQVTITLSAPAATGGVAVTVNDGTSSGSVTIPAGSTSLSFQYSTSPVAATKIITFSAGYNGVTKTAALTITPDPSAPVLSSFTLTPATVVGGTVSQGKVTLSSPAQVGGAVVTLRAGTETATVTIAAGSTSFSFPINTAKVTTTTTYAITASYGGITKNASLVVTP